MCTAIRLTTRDHYFVNHAAAFHSQFTRDDKDGIHHRLCFFYYSSIRIDSL